MPTRYLEAAVVVAGDNNALAEALSAGGSEAAAPYISKWLYNKEKGSDLTAEEKETETFAKPKNQPKSRHSRECGNPIAKFR